MKAIIYKGYGGPGVLRLAEVPTPEPAGDEVLIRAHAAGVNPIDARLRSGEMKYLLPGGFPRVPGYDVAGVVEAAGGKCPFAAGERVMAFLDHAYGGGYAEFSTCTHTGAVKIPDGMPFDEAAALPLAGSTALQSLRDHGRLKSGDRVLVNGASGGVGAFAVQIAKAYGAEVTGVAGGRHEGFVRSIGASDFIDYRAQDFTASKRRWDVIFDAAGKSSFRKARAALTPDGTYVSTEPSLLGLAVSLITRPMRRRGRVMLARPRGKDLGELVRLYSAGELKVSVAETFPLEAAADAHRRIEAGGFPGKLVIQIGAGSR